MFTKKVDEEKNSISQLPTPPASPSTRVSHNKMVTPPPRLIPRPKPKKEKKKIPRGGPVENLEEKHPLLCNLFYCFFFPYVCRCSPLELWEIFEVHTSDLAEVAVERGERGFAKRCEKYYKELAAYEKEKVKNPDAKEPSRPQYLFTLLFDVAHWDLLFALFCLLLSIGFQVVQPVFMRQLIKAVQQKMFDANAPFPVTFGVLLSLCPFLNAFFDGWGNRIIFHYSVQIRAAMNGMVYNKVFTLDMASQANLDRGKLISLVSNDSRNASEQVTQMFMIFFLPVQFFVPLGFVLGQFKHTGLIALAVLIVVLIPQFLFANGLQRSLKTYMISNDQRNRMTNETLQGIKVVKLTGLEEIFIQRVIESRAEQLQSTFWFTLWMQLVMSFMKLLPLLVNYCTVLTYVKVFSVSQLEFAVNVIPYIGFLQMMTQPTARVAMLVQAFTVVYIGINRIRDFLLLPDIKPLDVKPPPSDEVALIITGGSFKWGSGGGDEHLSEDQKKEKTQKLKIMKEVEMKAMKQRDEKRRAAAAGSGGGGKGGVNRTEPYVAGGDDQRASPSARTPPPSTPTPVGPFAIRTPSPSVGSASSALPDPNLPTLRNVNITLPKGSLTMVVGGVGSGKSSLACALIDEIPLVAGQIFRKGTFSYCPQTAWINNNTVRGNIAFGCDFDEERYLEVVRICALEPDIRSFPAGDLTAIGEKGANLSGGQKARIQLARCVYSNCDICVLDDPLSAVDVHVGKYLFEECICGYISKKTRVLMTNQLQYLDRADNIIVLANGEIIGQGTCDELKAQGLDFSEYLLVNKDRKKKKKGKEKKKVGKEKDEEKERDKERDVFNISKSKMIKGRFEGGIEEEDELREKYGMLLRGMSIDFPVSDVDDNENSADGDGEEESEKESMKEKAKGKKGLEKAKGKDYSAQTSGTKLTLKDLERGGKFSDEEVEAAKRIMTEEEYSQKDVAVSTYLSYLLCLMPGSLLIPYFLVTVIIEAAGSFAGYWMGIVGNFKKFSNVEYWNKILIYGVFIAIILVAVLIRTFTSAYAVLRSNRIIHDRLLRHVITAPPSFFDTTPLGRILNRFTSELSQTDQFLHTYLMTNVVFWLNLAGTVVVVSINTTSFLAIGLPTLFVFCIILFFYSGTARNLQRIDSISRSPVISVFTETISGAGLATIKAYRLQDTWKKRFNKINDDWSARKVVFKEGQMWASLYSSLAATLFMTGVVVLGWFLMEPSDLGVAINSSIQFAQFGMLIIQQNVELDSRMTSYERVLFYSTRLPQENNRELVVPPKNWPSKGTIVFDHVTFRYRPGLPYVLRDVSFHIQHGEKIGVCGRTGAGKSSLLFAMFRLVELDPELMPQMIDVETGFPVEEAIDEPPNTGRILLDGMDISKVGLSRVRQSISIIPQDPTLFTGSVRYNLDLSYKSSDDEIADVLSLIQMRQTVDDMPQGLDTPVSESGSNFSCGQRQLLCFGRAILNNSLIVILDEATAAVDVETDAKIQDMVRNHLKEQTVFVIAHRLNTIINSDRILVLDQGRIVEFDSPTNLQSNPSSAFNALIKSSSEED